MWDLTRNMRCMTQTGLGYNNNNNNSSFVIKLVAIWFFWLVHAIPSSWVAFLQMSKMSKGWGFNHARW